MTPADVKYSFDLAKIATHPQHPLWADTGLKSTQGRRATTSSSRSRASRATSSSTSTASTSRSSRSTSSRTTSTTDIATGNLERHEQARRHRPVRCTSPASARQSQTVVWKKRERLVGDEGARPERRRRRTSSTSRTARTPPRCRTCSPGTSTSSTTSRRSRRSRASSRRTSTRRRTTWARTRPGCSRTRRRKPLDDKAVPSRRSRTSINMNQILDKAYQGLVNKASPTGLLPIWNKWVDKKVVKQYGFSYNADQGEGDPRRRRLQGHERRRLRREQGRVEDRPQDRLPERVVGLDDVDPGDRRQREGRRHQDHAGVPRVRHARRRPRPREATTCCSATTGSTSNTPWTYYQYIFQLPILENQTTVNYERYSNPTAWNLTQAAGQDALDQHQGATRR